MKTRYCLRLFLAIFKELIPAVILRTRILWVHEISSNRLKEIICARFIIIKRSREKFKMEYGFIQTFKIFTRGQFNFSLLFTFNC
jgi:hypothetical protein